MIGKFEKGRWVPEVYIHPSKKEGHMCFNCVFNIVNLDNYHTDSHICCNPLTPYHCIELFEPVNCIRHATRHELYNYYHHRKQNENI